MVFKNAFTEKERPYWQYWIIGWALIIMLTMTLPTTLGFGLIGMLVVMIFMAVTFFRARVPPIGRKKRS